MVRPSWSRDRVPAAAVVLAVVVLALAAGGCGGGPPGQAGATPQIVPGTLAAPREVNLITRDYAFAPDPVELVPGETVLLHVVNGGLLVHEAVLGDATVQDAWEAAEAAAAGAPPGPTPVVTVPADVAGLRIVVASGERVDVIWTVPADAADAATPWRVACHIPGHLAKGMQVPIRWIPGWASAAASSAPTPAP